jgi:hypothetical protein
LSEQKHKWINKIQVYYFEIEYVKEKNNVVVDDLSRIQPTLSLIEVLVDWKALFLVEYSKNQFSCEILDGRTHDDRYIVVEDIIYYKDRIYLVPESQLKEKNYVGSTQFPIGRTPRVLENLQED